MTEFQLSHVALVAARISAFEPLGFNNRSQLAMRRVVPLPAGTSLAAMDEEGRRETLREQLPIWVHNILADPEFPRRDRLLPPLRRFEGELRDNKDDEVISSVLSHGFRNQAFDPLNLPGTLSMRERCAILAHVQTWEEAFLPLRQALVDELAAQADALDKWCEYARHPDYQEVG